MKRVISKTEKYIGEVSEIGEALEKLTGQSVNVFPYNTTDEYLVSYQWTTDEGDSRRLTVYFEPDRVVNNMLSSYSSSLSDYEPLPPEELKFFDQKGFNLSISQSSATQQNIEDWYDIL